MNIEGILKVLENAAKNLPSDARYEEAVACREAARIISQCRAAGFIDEKGEVRKVLGTLMYTEDGCIVADCGRVYFLDEDGDVIEWDASGTGDHIPVERCYSTREAAQAAAAKEADRGKA